MVIADEEGVEDQLAFGKPLTARKHFGQCENQLDVEVREFNVGLLFAALRPSDGRLGAKLREELDDFGITFGSTGVELPWIAAIIPGVAILRPLARRS